MIDIEDIFEDIFEDEEIGPDTHYLVMWDNTGLECVIPVDMSAVNGGRAMLDVLENKPNDYVNKMNRTLFMLKMRAQANGQRHYEIYFLRATGGITQNNIEDMFISNPQGAADLVREKGTSLYSNRAKKGPAII